MEEMIINIIGQLPLAVTVLVIWWLMERQQIQLDTKREESRQVSDAARDQHIDDLIKLSNNNILNIHNLTDRMTTMAACVTDIGQSVDIVVKAHERVHVEHAEMIDDTKTLLNCTTQIVEDIQGAIQVINEHSTYTFNERDQAIIEALAHMEQSVIKALEQDTSQETLQAILETVTVVRVEMEKLATFVEQHLEQQQGQTPAD